MLWFQPLPWARWTLIGLVVLFAFWLELRPESTIDVPFALQSIHPGDQVDESMIEYKTVPKGLFDGAEIGDVASRTVQPGEPVLTTHVDDTYRVVPVGWWVIPVELPDGANVGDPVRIIMLDTGEQATGVVAHPGSDDPFAAADGGVAVPPGIASNAAIAAANARLAVLISSG